MVAELAVIAVAFTLVMTVAEGALVVKKKLADVASVPEEFAASAAKL
jgi:hypothetical protein